MTIDPIDFFRGNLDIITTKELPTKFPKKISYVVRGDGFWEVRNNKIATFFLHRAKFRLYGFSDETFVDSFVFNLPLIPKKLFNTIVSFFRYISLRNTSECYVQIFWDPDNEKYYVDCPMQTASEIKVTYENSDVPTSHLLVCEIHSHNKMDAFFSATDDNDELPRGDRFFGVIGKLNDKNTYNFLLSYVAGNKRKLIEPSAIFEKEEDCTFPESWLERISFTEEHGEQVNENKFDF